MTRRATMEFSAKLTDQDVKDLGVLTRPKFYWPRLLLSNLRGTIILGALIWLGIMGLLGKTNLGWRATAVVWAIVAGVFSWGFFWTRGQRRRLLGDLNTQLPDRTRFTTSGVAWEGPGAARGFLPWSHFSGWRERGRLVSIDDSRRRPTVFVSVAHLADLERQQLRDFLRSKIPSSPGS